MSDTVTSELPCLLCGLIPHAHDCPYERDAVKELASLRARLLTLEQALETMPRYMEHDVVRRSSMAEYVSLDDVEAALAASRGREPERT